MDLEALDRAIAQSNSVNCVAESLLPSVSAGLPPSVLADRLLELAVWGILSNTAVQWLAQGAVWDGLQHEEIKTLDHTTYA